MGILLQPKKIVEKERKVRGVEEIAERFVQLYLKDVGKIRGEERIFRGIRERVRKTSLTD